MLFADSFTDSVLSRNIFFTDISITNHCRSNNWVCMFPALRPYTLTVASHPWGSENVLST